MSAIIFVFLLIFFFSAIIFTLTVMHLRGSRILINKLKDSLKVQSEELIVNYLYNNTATIEDINNFFKVKKERFDIKHVFSENIIKYFVNESTMRKEAMLGQLMELHKNITGDVEKNIRELYNESELKHYSYQKLKNKAWNVKVHGIRELTEMKVVDALLDIAHYINHKHSVLHTEAQMAVTRLSPDKDLSFLNHLTTRLTIWEQMHILNAIEEKGYEYVPEFSQWLDSKNYSVVLFAINMIAYYKQDRALVPLTKLMAHKDPNVRIAAIKTLGSLMNQSSPESTIY
jgi:energy-coupling factor transporter transmembrane protein EcfT